MSGLHCGAIDVRVVLLKITWSFTCPSRSFQKDALEGREQTACQQQGESVWPRDYGLRRLGQTLCGTDNCVIREVDSDRAAAYIVNAVVEQNNKSDGNGSLLYNTPFYINTNAEVIGVHTLNFKANFKFSRLEFFGRPRPTSGMRYQGLVDLQRV